MLMTRCLGHITILECWVGYSFTTSAQNRDYELEKTVKTQRNFTYILMSCYEFLNNDLARGLAALRQFGLRFILSHQGLFQLDGLEKDVAGAVRSLTGTKVCFRVDTDDMEEMARRMYLEEIDLEEEKEILRTKGVVDHERQIFHGGSESDTEGVVHTRSNQTGSNSGLSESTGEGFAAGAGLLGGSTLDREMRSSGSSSQSMESTSSSVSEVSAHTSSSSWQEQLVPVLADQVGGVYQLDEQVFKKGRFLALLPKRHFVLYRAGKGAEVCKTTETKTACPSDERIIKEQLELF